jgi:hypothetical protein
MNHQDWKLQIDNLVTFIAVEEEHYKTALQNKTEFLILQKMKERVENLQSDLQVFVDKLNVRQTFSTFA